MSNLYANTDPSQPDYNPISQAIQHSVAMDSAVKQAKYDEITQFDRYRKYPIVTEGESVDPSARFTYIPKVPPWFAGSITQQLMGNPDTSILPLDIGRDPNFSYAMYANADQRAQNLDNTWKLLANMPTSPLDDEMMKKRRQDALDSVSQRFLATSETADTYKQDALELQSAYNRQIEIQNLRQWDSAAHNDASQLEQAARDYHRLGKEANNLSLSGREIPEALIMKIAKSEDALKKASFEWDSKLPKRGFTGPKGPYLLSGFPGQGLDYLGDKAVQDFKNTENKIKEFQSRYSNNSEFRSEVNRGIKSKVPGIVASGIGAYLVKQKMDEGESMPKAIATTAGDIAISTAKFALKDRFVGMTDDLGAPEKDPYANARKQDPMFGLTPYQREQRMNNMSIIENEVNKQVSNMVEKNAIKSVNRSIAKKIREQMDEARVVEENITNSPLWNKQK